MQIGMSMPMEITTCISQNGILYGVHGDVREQQHTERQFTVNKVHVRHTALHQRQQIFEAFIFNFQHPIDGFKLIPSTAFACLT